jgi:plasmid replication initiation protein
MNNELMPKSSVAEYVLQHNAISRSIYKLSPYARKLIAMAMALLSMSSKDYSVTFTVSEFFEAMGLDYNKQGTNSKEKLRAAVEECLKSYIKIQMPDNSWHGYTWFSENKLFDYKEDSPSGWQTISMSFNPALAAILKAFKKAYAPIELSELGKLQSRYAIRYYEIAMSYSGFAGKDGNRPGEWYFDMTIERLRLLFQVDNNKYKATKDFRVRVIDNPLKDLNTAAIGLSIEPEYIRKGRSLLGARFTCRWAKPRIRASTQPPIESESDITYFQRTRPEEFEALRVKYLEESEEKKKTSSLRAGLDIDYGSLAIGRAAEELRKMYPHPDKTMPGKKKRGRPRKNPIS